MSINTRGLGRGLDALFHNNQAGTNMTVPASDNQFMTLPIDSVEPNPEQPRKLFPPETLNDLAASIREKGIIQPILVRPTDQPDRYQIIAGERRWRAAKLAGLKEITAQIREMDDHDTMLVALIENVQRDNLNPSEEARAMLALKDALGISQESLGEKLGKQRVTISNTLRLLKLPTEVQEDVAAGRLTAGHARVLLALPNGKWLQELRNHMIETDMSVRDAEDAVNFWRVEERFPWQKTGRPTPLEDADLNRLADALGTKLNCKAKITGSAERGRINIAYTSHIQLEALLRKMGLPAEGASES